MAQSYQNGNGKRQQTQDVQVTEVYCLFQRDLSQMPYGLFTGYAAAVGWDPETAHLTHEGDPPSQS